MLTKRACCCGGTCGDCCLPCLPCVIPKVDLSLAAHSTGSGTTTTVLLRWNGVAWATGVLPGSPFFGISFELDCGSGATHFSVTDGTFTCEQPGGTSGALLHLDSFTCNPFALNYSTTLTDCVFLNGNLDTFKITAPSISGFPVCCQTFHAEGCNGRDIAGATVSVYDAMGGTLLASGTTSATGLLTPWWSGSCNAYVTATEPSGRLAGYAASLSATATGTTVLSLLPEASGYTCLASCALPLADTLHVTFPAAGAQTLTASAGVWTSSFTFSGHAYVITLTGSSNAMAITRDGVSCGTVFHVVTSCPPSFASTIILPTGTCKTELGGNGTMTE